MPDRRSVLGAALGGAAMLQLGLARGASAAAAGPAKLTATALPGGLQLISGCGTNVVAARGGRDGAILVDGGLASRAEETLALVRSRTRAPGVGTVFNTCWRLEQTGANDLLASKGAIIVAHENTRLWMSTEIPARWEEKVYPPRDPKARPQQTFYDTGTMPLGDGRIDYGYLIQAHTDGDIYVHFKDANVLCTGAAVAGQGWPVIDWSTGGWMGGHIRGLETLMKVADDKTVIVPAVGPTLSRADLEKQRAMYVAIMAKLQEVLESGRGLADALAAKPAAPYEAERGDPTQFLTLSYRSFWGHIRSFRGV